MKSSSFYGLVGVAFGLSFPVVATTLGVYYRGYPLSLSGFAELQGKEPLLWIIDTAPLFLGLFAWLGGRRHDAFRMLNEDLEFRVRVRTEELEQSRRTLEEQVCQSSKARHEFEVVSSRLKAVLDAATEVAIIATNMEGVITVFNRGAERMLGYSASEMVDKQTPMAFHLESEVLERQTAMTLEFGQEISGFEVFVFKAKQGSFDLRDWTYVRKDGTQLRVRLVITAKHEGDRLTGFLGVAVDQTALMESQQALTETEASLGAILEGVVDGIISIDEAACIRSFNKAATQIFQFSEEEVLGKNVKMLMPEPFHSEHDRYMADYRDTSIRKIMGIGREVVGRRKDGSSFPMDLAVSEVTNSRGRLFVGIVRDITERRDAEERLKRAMCAAEEANTAKSRFLASMSHELRTPLNAIIGYSEMLHEDAQDEGNEALLADVQKINTAGKHLLKLISDILDLSKIEAGKMELSYETFEIARLLDDIVVTGTPLATKNRNKLVLEVEKDVGRMHSDATRIRQCLLNLVGNACKFTSDGTVKLRASRETGESQDWILFEVTDSGIGMSEEQIGKVFEPFTQADASTTRKYGGTGLGLAITRNLCLHLGGEITVRSGQGVGSTFQIRLPALLEDLSSSVSPPITPADSKGDRAVGHPRHQTEAVLVIDDDPQVLELMKRTLVREGYQVLCASSGEEGIRLARKHRPLAITLDVMMPELDGWAVLQEIKSDAELSSIPVIMLSMVDEKGRGLALGARDFLIKPVNKMRLLELLNRERFPGAKGPVLIVDDDPNSREMLSRMLLKEDWPVVHAANGIEALEQLRETTPSIILLDLMMPEMDGFQFIEALQKLPGACSIPVVVLTAKVLEPAEQARLRTHVQQVLAKGTVPKDFLFEIIRDTLARTSPRKDVKCPGK